MDFCLNFKWLLSSRMVIRGKRSKWILALANRCSSTSKISVSITKLHTVKILCKRVFANLDKIVLLLMVLMNLTIWITRVRTKIKIIRLKCVNNGMRRHLDIALTEINANSFMMKEQVLSWKEKLWVSKKRKKISSRRVWRSLILVR